MEYIVNDKRLSQGEYQSLLDLLLPVYVGVKKSHKSMRMTRLNEKLSEYHIRVKDSYSYGTLIGIIKDEKNLISLEVKYEDGRQAYISSIKNKDEHILLNESKCGRKFMDFINRYKDYLPNDSTCMNEAEYHKRIPLWVSEEWRLIWER